MGLWRGKWPRPHPFADPQGAPGISSISSTPQWSQELQRGKQALEEVVAGPGAGWICPSSGASGDSDVDSLTLTTPTHRPQFLPVEKERPVAQILGFLSSELGVTPIG